jgi:hypothetical protein
MSNWMRFHLNGGKSNSGEEIVPTATLIETYKPQMQAFDVPPTIVKPIFPISDVYSSVDMGWFTNIDRGTERDKKNFY